ncbi:TVP38/TMEM64 family protein [Cysteiniphilum sp. 6C5]|uniref:TVP38/TMEM64 family protein n=1 Tax=unclassified Cysteiniphilum TaxID=2610889 RepID=UPI003F85A054
MSLKRLVPIIILIIGLIIFFALGGEHYLSLETLTMHYQTLQAFTQQHYLLSVFIFMLSYIIIVAFSIPGATIMTLLGGFLFGVFFGSIWTVLAATIGATITYLAVRMAFAQSLKNKASGSIAKMRDGFQQNEFNYLLFLRLLPIFPFFIINIAVGVLGVSLRHFFIGTLLGIIPGTFIYAWVGSGLGFALEQGHALNLKVIFSPQILLPICALALLSLVPIIYRKLKGSSKLKGEPHKEQ